MQLWKGHEVQAEVWKTGDRLTTETGEISAQSSFFVPNGQSFCLSNTEFSFSHVFCLQMIHWSMLILNDPLPKLWWWSTPDLPARKRRRYERVRRRSRLRGSFSLAGGCLSLMSFHNMHYKVKIDTGHFFIFSGTAKRDCYPRPEEDIVQFRGCLTTYCTHHPMSWAKDM